MKISPETREILSQYKARINAQRREHGLRTLNTAQVIDEICDYLRYQPAVYIGGAYLRQSGR